MKKIVEPITGKVKIKHLHCGMVAACNSTKLVCYATKKRGGDTRACAVDYSECHRKFCSYLLMKIKISRQEVSHIIEQQQQTIESSTKVMPSGKRERSLEVIDVDRSSKHLKK